AVGCVCPGQACVQMGAGAFVSACMKAVGMAVGVGGADGGRACVHTPALRRTSPRGGLTSRL
ncbi:hypothetical protein FIBSPDRAFT_858476, partial [Athelia psychrophila]